MEIESIKQDAGELISYFVRTIKFEKLWKHPHIAGDHWLGRRYCRERVQACAAWSAQNYDGDFIEIGALYGETTVKLAEIAKKYNRKVIVIDPWSEATEAFDGTLDYIQGNEYDIWRENTKEYSDIIEVYRTSSHDPKLSEILKERELCFAWVDGSHTAHALRNDLNLVKHTAVIGVDDISYWLWCDICQQRYSLFAEFHSFAAKNEFQTVKLDWISEGYIFCKYKKSILTRDFLGDKHKILSNLIEYYASIATSIYQPEMKRYVWVPGTVRFEPNGDRPDRPKGTPIFGTPLEFSKEENKRIGPLVRECKYFPGDEKLMFQKGKENGTS